MATLYLPVLTGSSGYVRRLGVDETFSAISSGVGTDKQNGAFANISAAIQGSTTTNQFSQLIRGILTFDTSLIPAGSTINSVTLSLFATGNNTSMGVSTVHVVGTSRDATTSLVNSDYQLVGSTSFGSLSGGSINVGLHNNVALDSNGIASISLSGPTSFALRTAWDLNGTFTGTWSNSVFSGQYFATAYPDFDEDNLLVIDYTPPPTRDKTQTAISNIKPALHYTMGSTGSAPNTSDSKNSLATVYTPTQVSDVATDDNVFVDLMPTNTYAAHHYKTYVSGTPSAFNPEWKGKPFKNGPIYMQIYNAASSVWETVDSDTGAGVELTLNGSITSNIGNYIDSDNYIAVRVYQ